MLSDRRELRRIVKLPETPRGAIVIFGSVGMKYTKSLIPTEEIAQVTPGGAAHG